MTMLDAFHTPSDPGIHAIRLAAGRSIEATTRRKRPAKRYVEAAFGWFVIGLLCWLALVALP